MQVFDPRWKTSFISDVALFGVSLGIKIHPPDPNGRQFLAFDRMNN